MLHGINAVSPLSPFSRSKLRHKSAKFGWPFGIQNFSLARFFPPR